MMRHAASPPAAAHLCLLLLAAALGGAAADCSCRTSCRSHLGCSAADVSSAMEATPSHRDVQNNGCWALAGMPRSDVAAAGGIEAVMAAMGNFPDDSGVQYHGCQALGHIAEDSPGNQGAIRLAGGADRVRHALSALTGEAGVQRACQLALDTIGEDVCLTISCGSHGQCDSGSGSCICDTHYFDDESIPGADCYERNTCSNVDCGAHGSCIESAEEDWGEPAQAGTCDCEDGYAGDRCDSEDKCLDVECGSHGVCNSQTGQCDCEDSTYFGAHCERHDVCHAVTCVQGRCREGVCHCNPNYGGEHCDIFDPCASHSCGANGRCRLEEDGLTPTCDCNDSWYGDLCQELDPCRDMDCGAHGQCRQEGEEGVCVCEEAVGDKWYGDHCESHDLCWGVKCGTGQCDAATGQCDCGDFTDFSGEHCEIFNKCFNRANSCGQHGQCYTEGEGEEEQQAGCSCDDGYSGAKCDAFDLCFGISCGSHGRCQGQDGSCECHGGWTGAMCDEPPPDPCADISCGQHGWCIAEVGTCACDEHFSGDHCERADLGTALMLGIVEHRTVGVVGVGLLGVVGVAAALKRRAASGGGIPGEKSSEMLAPLASAV